MPPNTVSNGQSGNVLVLAGTAEARKICSELSRLNIKARASLAGRVATPKPLDLQTRIGGFGGVDGLAGYLEEESITHVVDATHPFASQMSHNALQACSRLDIKLGIFRRVPWQPKDGDHWINVPDVELAVAALPGSPRNVFLGIGRQNLSVFAAQPQHHYLCRIIDPPQAPPPLPSHSIVLAKGPFDLDADIRLLRDYNIDIIVSKNSGGTATRAKIDAARALQIPVIMIGRPSMSLSGQNVNDFHTISDLTRWLSHELEEASA